ncbi:MAG TPA: hypothetical protein PKG54_17060 [Phycisphaerae bacterium]|jgi:hypothetical protein|nr:hypothetical protein [Phycisphaerae bacterium]HOB76224.1 hypothetical protein [Phycisphaerae bacterium]HOJ56198.1 hypothetical protein [Phycisphaerae bacterium]HOL28076.1 hypothetical protein [Phycisphaerae bacterium]HPP22434.1 hypothetical protein [Phycisphaerae bacterium]
MTRRDDSEPLEFLLLDYHLNRLSSSEADTVKNAVAHSPELAAASQGLRDVLNLLDRYPAAETPDDLPDKILARINERSGVIPIRQQPVQAPTGATHELSGSPVLSLRELIAIAACIALFISVFVPGYFKARNAAMRNLCRADMLQLSQAISNYAQAGMGELPSAGYVPGGFWREVRIPNVRRASNTRHPFLLLRLGYISEPHTFLCPADADARPMLPEGHGRITDPKELYKAFTDFAERANNSYSFLFMNRAEGLKIEDLAKEGADRMALAADRNPLFDGRAIHRLNPYEEESFNSPTHENGAGQNVLYSDGHAAWATTPLLGRDRDNIYRSGQLVRYLGNESPASPTDSFLP